MHISLRNCCAHLLEIYFRSSFYLFRRNILQWTLSLILWKLVIGIKVSTSFWFIAEHRRGRHQSRTIASQRQDASIVQKRKTNNSAPRKLSEARKFEVECKIACARYKLLHTGYQTLQLIQLLRLQDVRS